MGSLKNNGCFNHNEKQKEQEMKSYQQIVTTGCLLENINQKKLNEEKNE
jgi:hypothetical protein